MSSLARVLAHPLVVHLARGLAARRPLVAEHAEHAEAVRHAAVALTVRLGTDDTPEALFIRRAEYAGDPWSGHVALPGGRREADDASLAATAIRETREEVGIDLARDGTILGALDDVSPRTPVLPPIVIRPFVAAVRTEVDIVPSAEIAGTFWLPIACLADPSARGDAAVLVRGVEQRVACFRYREHVIWGLTERIVRQFLALVP